MSIQATGYFAFSGPIITDTISVSVNGIVYTLNTTYGQTIDQVVNNYVSSLNSTPSFSTGFMASNDSDNLVITALSGGHYDGDAGNLVSLVSNTPGNTQPLQAYGTWAFTGLASRPGNGCTVTVNGIQASNTYNISNTPQSFTDGIISQLNSYPDFTSNFNAFYIDIPGGGFGMEVQCLSTGAYVGSAGNMVPISTTGYTGVSGPYMSGGKQPSVAIVASSPYLIGGVSYNMEILNSMFQNFSVSSHQVAQIVPNPNHMLTMDILNDNIIGWLSEYLTNYLIAKGLCPPVQTSPFNVVEGFTYVKYPNDEGVEYLAKGYYYRIPVDTNNIVNGQSVPKYLNDIPLPFTAFPYPDTDQYAGMMLVKTFEQITVMYHDISMITQTQAQIDLQRNVFTIFAL